MKEKNAGYGAKRRTESAYGVEKKECAVNKGYRISLMAAMGTWVEAIATSVVISQLLTIQVHNVEII